MNVIRIVPWPSNYLLAEIPTGLPGGSAAKNLPAMRRHGFSPFVRKIPWVGKIPLRRKWQPTPVYLPGKSHGQRNLGGLQFMGSQESDTETKQQQQEISAPYSNRAPTVEKLEKEILRDYMKERKDCMEKLEDTHTSQFQMKESTTLSVKGWIMVFGFHKKQA